MFDVWLGEVNITVFVLIISILIVLPVQLLLCFKVKNLFIRLLPALVFSLLLILFLLLTQAPLGWAAVSYLFFAIYAGFMLLMSALAWGIWALVKTLKSR